MESGYIATEGLSRGHPNRPVFLDARIRSADPHPDAA